MCHHHGHHHNHFWTFVSTFFKTIGSILSLVPDLISRMPQCHLDFECMHWELNHWEEIHQVGEIVMPLEEEIEHVFNFDIPHFTIPSWNQIDAAVSYTVRDIVKSVEANWTDYLAESMVFAGLISLTYMAINNIHHMGLKDMEHKIL